MRLAIAARFLAQLESVNPIRDGDRSVASAANQPVAKQLPIDYILLDSRSQKEQWNTVTKARPTTHGQLEQKYSWKGVLRNIKNLSRENAYETNRINARLCDPTSDEADVGLLSCGFNYYCAESQDSYLGGVCSNVVKSSKGRRLQDSDAGIFETIDLNGFCDPSSPTAGTYSCDCNNFDLSSGSGYLGCLLAESYCFQECPEICTRLTAGELVRQTFTTWSK